MKFKATEILEENLSYLYSPEASPLALKYKEAIEELEALGSRSCDTCKYHNRTLGGLCFRLDITVSSTFYCQVWEAKQ